MQIPCECGLKLDAPNMPPTLKFGNYQGKFTATIETVCPKCGKVHFTRYNGKLVREKE